MKSDSIQTYTRKSIKTTSKQKHAPRDLTPDLKRPKLTISTFTDIFQIPSTNQSITLLKADKNPRKRIISSYSPGERKLHSTTNNSIHNTSMLYSMIKASSIPKKTISNYRKSYLKKSYGFISSRSKNRKKAKRSIPTANKKATNISYGHIKGNSTNSLLLPFNSLKLTSSTMLTDKEKNILSSIGKKIFSLINETKNKDLIINELENILYKAKCMKNNCNYNSNGNINHHKNCRSASKTSESISEILRKNIHNNGNKSKNEVKKNLRSFKSIKMHPKNITDEVDNLKYNAIPTNTSINNISNKMNNKGNTLFNSIVMNTMNISSNHNHHSNNIIKGNNNHNGNNKSKIALKNASLNLHMIPKVNGIEKYSKHNGNESSQRNVNLGSNGIDNKSERNISKNEDNNNNNTSGNSIHMIGLNLEEIQNNKVRDFNEEFLENYNEFSPSWRLEADKMNQRKNY